MSQDSIDAFVNFLKLHGDFVLIASNNTTFYRYISQVDCGHSNHFTLCNGIIQADELKFVELNYPEYFI